MTNIALQSYLREAIAASHVAKRKIQLPARTFQLLSRPHEVSTTPQRAYSQTSTRNTNRVPTSAPPRIGPWKPSEKLDLAAVVKGCMRAVRHPLSIITSTDLAVDTDGDPRSWRGVTVASFNTVSMDPQPMVSFNIHQESSTLKAIESSRYFAVNVLARSDSGEFLARKFAQRHTPENFIDETDETRPASWIAGNKWSKASDKTLPGFDPRIFPPRLQIRSKTGKIAVLFSLLCHVPHTPGLRAGDHRIVVGRVIHTVHAQAEAPNQVMTQLREEDATFVRGISLGYHDGRYDTPRKVAKTFQTIVHDTLKEDPTQNWNRDIKKYKALQKLRDLRGGAEGEGLVEKEEQEQVQLGSSGNDDQQRQPSSSEEEDKSRVK